MAKASMISFDVDQDMLKAIERKLGSMKSQAPKVLKMAINDTARKARKDLATKAQETYAVKGGAFSRYVRLKSATTGSLEATLTVRGKRLPLSKKFFSVRGGHGPNGPRLVTLVNKLEGPYTWRERAFQNKISDAEQSGGGHEAVAKYIGGGSKNGKKYWKNRLKIVDETTLSIPQMFGSEKHVYGVVEPHIMDNLQASVNRHVDRILKGG